MIFTPFLPVSSFSRLPVTAFSATFPGHRRVTVASSGVFPSAGSEMGHSLTNEVVWTVDLSVGNDVLDGQHKRFIEIINRLGQDGLSREEVADRLSELLEYAARHFHDEEDHILVHAPQIFEEHVALHAEFIETVHDFAQRLQDGEDQGLASVIHAFARDWLISHIKKEDRNYRDA
jgi:hemerythrin